MKKIVYVCIVTFFLFAVVIVEQIYVDNTLNNLIGQIENLDTAVESFEQINTENIQSIIDNLDEFWTNHEQILCITINHNDLNRVGEEIKKIKVYISQNNKKDCVYEIKTLAFYAESYKHVMEINIQNLL